MFVAGVQRSRATGINGNPSIPLKILGITLRIIFILPLVSALISLPVAV